MDAAVTLKCPSFGVCREKPTDQEEINNDVLTAFVSEHASAGPPTFQLDAIRELHTLFTQWVHSKSAECHMFLAGSYKMNVHTERADIDAVFVTTSGITRDDVFREFAKILEAHEGVSELTPVPNARVPLLALVLKGQEFDVMTCHLRVPKLPERDAMLSSYVWMNGLDEASILAFNGPRVTDVILRSMPRPKHFLIAVRFLRLWSKQRFIYSNKSGFLGGINIVLLAAFVALRNPKANSVLLVQKTVQAFSKWDWRTEDVSFDIGNECPVWLRAYDLRQQGSKRDAMTIFAPCFPRFNTLHAACESSSKVIVSEFLRAAEMLSVSSQLTTDILTSVCARLDISRLSTRFIRISVSSSSEQWMGYIESQARFLVHYLSKEELAIANFRFVPIWVDGSCYITADDDKKIRTYAVKGDMNRVLTYFETTHASNGPPRPKGATISLAFVLSADVPFDAIVKSTKAFEELIQHAPRRTLSVSSTQSHKPVDKLTESFPPQHSQVFGTIQQKFNAKKSKLKRLKVKSAIPSPKPRCTVVRPRFVDGSYIQQHDVWVGAEWRRGICNLAESEFWTHFSKCKSEQEFVRNVGKKKLLALRGKKLGCWCANTPECHAHTIARIVNDLK